MAASWTVEQVLSLAPDAASAKTGQTQASRSRWSGLGASERAIWGLCQGSGKQPYQTVVDLPEPAFRCSCPSRKFPCKHSLGLMLLWARDAGALAAGAPPDWAAEWLQGRDTRFERRTAPAAPADHEKARADAEKRVARREQRVADGIAELRLWLDDLVRHGFAQAEQRGYQEFAQMAARLVDAQAPGLARRVRAMGGALLAREDWPERLLEQAGRLWLLIDAYERIGELPPGLQAELRSLVGWTVTQEELLRTGERVTDRWHALGQVVEEDERLRTRRTWLRGETTRRDALLLDFAHTSQPLPPAPAPGHVMEGELAFHPAAWPQRAAIVANGEPGAATRGEDADHGGSPASGAVPGPGGPIGVTTRVVELYEQRARALAASPWVDRHPAVVAATPVEQDGRWLIADGERAAIPLLGSGETALTLCALAGGRPLTLFAEWEPRGLRPLTAWPDGRAVTL